MIQIIGRENLLLFDLCRFLMERTPSPSDSSAERICDVCNKPLGEVHGNKTVHDGCKREAKRRQKKTERERKAAASKK